MKAIAQPTTSDYLNLDSVDLRKGSVAEVVKHAFLFAYLTMLGGGFYLVFSTLSADSIEATSKDSNVYILLWLLLYAVLGVEILSYRGVAAQLLAKMTAPLLLATVSLMAYASGGAESGAVLKLIMFMFTIVFAAWLTISFGMETVFEYIYKVAAITSVIQLALYPVLKNYAELFDKLERVTVLGLTPYSGLFGHKNLAGGFFALSILIRVSSRANLSVLRKPVHLFLFGLQVVCFLWSGAVTSIVAVAFALVAIALIKILRESPALGAVAFVLACVLGLWLMSDVSNVLDAFGRDVQMSGREDLYDLWPRFFWQHPVLGYGYSEFFSTGPNAPSVALNLLTRWGDTVTFESAYLEALIDFGAVGGLILAYVIVGGLISSLRSAAGRSSHRDAPLAVMVYLIVSSVSANFIVLHNCIFSALLFYCYFGPRSRPFPNS